MANGATSMQGFAYNNAGYPVGSSRANGTTLQWGYDGVGRMNLIIHGLAGTGHDATWSHSYDPASQISAVTRDNDAYAWNGHYAVSRPYTTNGLNQYSAAGGTAFTYDPNGNLVEDGAIDYAYDIENRLVERSGGTVLTYDPLGRLFQVSAYAVAPVQFLYDPGSGSGAGSDALVAEYVSGAMTRRYVHNVGMDTPLLSYAGTNLSTPSYLHADERGSIVAVADPWGVGAINRYDEYGIPASTNVGRFQYTGQIWLPELGMYYYKARVYSPTLGRFLQADPIGYGGGMNLYAYVGNDPVNFLDPTGLDPSRCMTVTTTWAHVVWVQGREPGKITDKWDVTDSFCSDGETGSVGGDQSIGGQTIVVTGDRCRTDPGPVNFNGYIWLAPAGPSVVGGEFTNVNTRQTGTVVAVGYGFGLTFGRYSRNATLNDIDSILGGFEVSFAFGPFGLGGGANIHDLNNEYIGSGSVGASISPPFGAGGISIDGAAIRSIYGRRC